MVVEEALPGLVMAMAAGSRAVLADRRIRHADSDSGKFGLDPLAAPGGIGGPHLADEVNPFTVQARSAGAGAGFPTPKEPKAQPMPSQDRPRLNNHKRPLPIGPAMLEAYPKQTIRVINLRPGDRAL